MNLKNWEGREGGGRGGGGGGGKKWKKEWGGVSGGFDCVLGVLFCNNVFWGF